MEEKLMFVEEHKTLVEEDKEYEYIGSEKRNYHWFLNVKHLYCKKIYEIRIDSWKNNRRPCGAKSNKGCCGSYENSFAYHIEVELGLNLDDIWNWEKNNELGINPYHISKQSHIKVWIYCQENVYHNDNGGYEIRCSDFYNKKRCSYCKKQYKVHPKDSFAQWGIDNFGEDFLEKYWSSSNTLNPWKISPQSNEKIWLYCQENEEHNYDRNGNKIGYEASCSHFYGGNRCSYCHSNKVHWKDSLAYNYPQIAKMIAIPENGITFDDCYSIACQTHDKYYFKCLDCETISYELLTLKNVTSYRYSCKKCGDGISIPNKFAHSLLTQLKVNFTPEHSPYYLKEKSRVDFLLTNYNRILEMDGGYGNHTKEYNYWRDFLNLKYGGYKTIRVDLTDDDKYRKDLFNYLKEQTINSELSKIFDLSNIDWVLAWEESQKSKCVEAWKLYNNTTQDIIEISKMLDLNKSTVVRYLKIGAECGKCNYTPKKSIKNGAKKRSGKNHVNSTRIICKTTKELFYAIAEAKEKYKVNNIGKCCKNEINYAGKLEDGTPLVWRYININHNKILRGNDILKLHSKINQEVA